ncbi:MAG TPA: hypothetical protein VEK07_14830 [Polyangiaceae bacterium]|nr:hypothetical protein [Polyangiaceae bacterium]
MQSGTCRPSSHVTGPAALGITVWAGLGIAVSVGLALGCEGAPPAQSPADRAAFMEKTRCGADVDENAIAPVLDAKAVEGVSPMYATVDFNKSGEQSQLRGATLRVSALPGVTAEWLDRALECHGARVVLGLTKPATPDDPFVLPGSILDIDVRPAKDGFLVGVAGFSAQDARKILDRAQAFGKAKTAPPSSP